MNSVCFYNDGKLDKRAFTMLGLSAKSDDSAIGFFGTGFKYAIATLLRNGCTVSVTTCNRVFDIDGDGYLHCLDVETYTFTTRRDKFRDKEFDFIQCTHRTGDVLVATIELPFTTHLGANWQLWQAYRELYTNALDEKGGVALVNLCDLDEARVTPGDVCVYVCGEEFVAVHEQHDKYFINAEKAVKLASSRKMRALEKYSGSDNVIYYKTMYTGTRLAKETYLTYDYTAKQTLTEDRTIVDTWYIAHHIAELWLEGMDYDTLVDLLPKISDDRWFEYTLCHNGMCSDAFKKACAYLVEHHRPIPMWARDVYTKTLPFDKQIEPYEPTRFEKKQLDKAMRILAFHKCMVDEMKVHLCVSLPNNLLGYYRDGEIFIAKETFERGFERLLGTLYEEYLHQQHSFEDYTLKMQNFLVDRCASLMVQVYDLEYDSE